MSMFIGICSSNLNKAVEPDDTKPHWLRSSVGLT